MSTLMDIKFALRLLLKAPRFTALTLLVLIGGLSISLFTFSFFYSIMYKPLQLPEGETVINVSAALDGDTQQMPGYEFNQVRDQLSSFAELGSYSDASVRLTIGEAGKNVPASYVEPGIFRFSRTQPLLGRELQQQDLTPGAPPVVVISYHTWQQDLQGEQEIIGQVIKLGNVNTTIVGIMPAQYRFPINSKLWLPMPQYLSRPESKDETYLSAYGRLVPGTSLTTAQTELGSALDMVYQQRVREFKLAPATLSAKLQSFPLAQIDGNGDIVFTFLNLVAFFILLLACINTGNLLLARAIERQKETAIRAALGAPTGRLVSQLMWEGVLITLLGSVLSLLLVTAVLDYADMALRSFFPNGLPFWWQWGMDLPTLLMAIVFTGVTLLLASFLPAWRSARQDINATLRDGTRGAQGKKAGRLSRLLVTAQVFLISTLMLIGSMAAFVSQKLINLDFGFNYHQVMRGSIDLPVDKYATDQQQSRFFETLVSRLKQQPNINGAISYSYRGQLPLTLEGMDYAHESDKPQVDTLSVIGNSEFYGPHLVAGRHLGFEDKAGVRKTALISQSMANRYWPGEPVIGKHVRLNIDGEDHRLAIVGVVTDRINASSMFRNKHTDDEIYISGLQFVYANQRIYFNHDGDEKRAEGSFYQSLLSIDRFVEVDSLRPGQNDLNTMRQTMQYVSNLTFGAGAFALLLALTGIYGLTANAVSQRTHEMGIRRSVGATDRDIMLMFLKQGSKQLIIGLGLGLALFALIATSFHSFTDGMLPWQLVVSIALAVTIGLTLVVLTAIYLPTRRAVIMEPSAALRYE